MEEEEREDETYPTGVGGSTPEATITATILHRASVPSRKEARDKREER
jgi:hypothetical protein